MNPERIADYELVEYLTAGGMADLYLARSPRQDAPVVIKTIQKKYVELTRVVKMFIDEGRIAKALDHPNIVRIHDVGQERGAYFIAMELIQGRDLLAIARRGVEVGRFLPRHLAIAIVRQVTTGLTYAHERRDGDGRPLSIVHCDISPGNVVVSFGGTAKIVDFGIARATIQLRAEDHTVAGKYNYMAPEQIRGAPLDARADIFSLGVILYELTVGRRLFRGRPEEVKERVLRGDIPRPRAIRPELPEALETVILKMLAADPDQRYRSARELRAALGELLLAEGKPAGKREIAEYLREIFGEHARPQKPGNHSSPIAILDGFAREAGEEEQEELQLDAPVPRHEELVVDPDEPEPEPEAPTPSASRTPSPSPSPSPAASASPSGQTHPIASRDELLLAAIAIVVAVVLYLLFRA